MPVFLSFVGGGGGGLLKDEGLKLGEGGQRKGVGGRDANNTLSLLFTSICRNKVCVYRAMAAFVSAISLLVEIISVMLLLKVQMRSRGYWDINV